MFLPWDASHCLSHTSYSCPGLYPGEKEDVWRWAGGRGRLSWELCSLIQTACWEWTTPRSSFGCCFTGRKADSLQNILSAGKLHREQRHIYALTQDGVPWTESLKQRISSLKASKTKTKKKKKKAQSASWCFKVHLLLMVYFYRKILAMIKIHKSFIESCSPLAKTVLEMLSLKNFTKDSMLQIKLPPQLLLDTVYQRIVNVVGKPSQVHVRQSDNTHSNR